MLKLTFHKPDCVRKSHAQTGHVHSRRSMSISVSSLSYSAYRPDTCHLRAPPSVPCSSHSDLFSKFDACVCLCVRVNLFVCLFVCFFLHHISPTRRFPYINGTVRQIIYSNVLEFVYIYIKHRQI